MIQFAKVESIGNDFVLIQANPLLDYPAIAQRLCPRRYGVGSDGLLVVQKRENGLDMRMFNPDGTEDFCGNGLRCAARYAFDKALVGSSIDIVHGGKIIPVEIKGDSIETTLGPASFKPADVPVVTSQQEVLHSTFSLVKWGDYDMTSLTTGSTHTILSVKELPADEEFEAVSRALEHYPMFPERTSIIWMRVDSETDISIRIWERGANETLGCGTGSSAAAVLRMRDLGHGGAIGVHNPGGTVHVSADDWEAPLAVKGTARVVFEGEADP